MEDVLALIIISVLVGIVALFVSVIMKAMRQRRQMEKETFERRKKEIEDYWKDRYAKEEKVKKANAEPIARPKPAMKKANITETYANMKPTTTSTSTAAVAQSDDGFFNGMITGYAINSLLHSGESKAEERSVGVSSRESSWGFDDDDSRKSVSSTFSSSDSSSSWDSGSSSSDSGPSSDW